jgi:hypothetical protein
MLLQSASQLVLQQVQCWCPAGCTRTGGRHSDPPTHPLHLLLQVLARLSHPNIIGYKESFLDGEGVLCIITSFCAEGDLATAIRRRAAAKAYFTEDEIMDVFIQVTGCGRGEETGAGGWGWGWWAPGGTDTLGAAVCSSMSNGLHPDCCRWMNALHTVHTVRHCFVGRVVA